MRQRTRENRLVLRGLGLWTTINASVRLLLFCTSDVTFRNMNGAQVERARKRLGLSVQAFADRCRVSRKTAWSWGCDGVEGPAEALIELLVHTHQGLHAMSGRNFDKMRTRDRMRRQGVEAVSEAKITGGLAAEVRAIVDKPKIRRPRAHARRLAENATEDYLRKGGTITKLPTRKR